MTIMTLPQPRLSGLFEPRTIVSQPTPQTDTSNNFGVQLPDPYNEILFSIISLLLVLVIRMSPFSFCIAKIFCI